MESRKVTISNRLGLLVRSEAKLVTLCARYQARVVLYCNGPFCQKSKRLAAELLEAGFTNVRRYQLGMPTWRAPPDP